MSAKKRATEAVDSERRWIYRVGSISAIAFGIAYIIIIALYLPMGAPPSDTEAKLAYLAGNTMAWWAILGLSVLTDLLLIPVALSLYSALKAINKSALWLATAFIGLFVVLDLALTQMNYALLIGLGGNYTAATNDAQRAVVVATATYPSMVLESNLLFVYNSLTLAVGILITGLVMLKGVFSKSTAYLGVVTGILGTVSVASSLFAPSVSSIAIILTSVLTTVWYLSVGYRLYRLGQQ